MVILPYQVSVGDPGQVLLCEGTHRFEVGEQVDEWNCWHRLDLLHGLPSTVALGGHPEPASPPVSCPHFGTPKEEVVDPPVLDPHHVPDEPGNVIGLLGRLP